MITSTDTELIGQARVEARRLTDLEAAIRFALSEIRPEYRWGLVHVFISFNFLSRPKSRITPYLEIKSPSKYTPMYRFDPETVELDLLDCLRQVNDRFNREHVTWGDLRIDIKKQRMNKWDWTRSPEMKES